MDQKKDDHTGSKDVLFQRRGFIKTAGVAVASLVGASATVSASEDYDVVEVPAGGHKSYSLSDGETFENVLFDCTNSNTRVSITATGENWTIRNVGIRGVHDQDGGHAVLGLSAANGTDCRVENVWMGDGSASYDGAGSSETGAWVAPDSTGTITFKQCFFRNWKDNGIYASSPGGDGNGAVIIDECYAANNNHADFRIGSTGSVVKNSAVEHTKSMSDCRGIWCWYNPGLEIRNVDVNMQGNGASIHAGPYEPGEVDVYDTQYAGPLVEDGQGNGQINLMSGNGTSPSVSVPDGVPLSAKEAASGTSSSGSSDDSGSFDHLLAIDGGVASDSIASYEFEVSGDIQKSTADGASINDDDVIDGHTVTGAVAGGKDAFDFNGELVSITVDGEAEVTVDGQTVDVSGSSTRTLRVETPDGGDLVEYELVTSGEVTLGDAAESPDSVTQNDDGTYTITGIAGNGYDDSFQFQGEFLEGTLSGGDATVLVDGQPVDLDGSSSHTLRVETADGGDLVEYELVTSGEATLGDAAESPDSVTQNDDGTYTITGVCGNGYDDSFQFQGEFLEGTVSGGDATVLVDGAKVLSNSS